MLKDLDNVTYFRLNNEINRPINGVIPLQKDQEALEAFMKENVEPHYVKFDTFKDRIDYLIEHDYIDTTMLDKYSFEFMENLHKWLYEQNFKFGSFMAAYKFYQQYALKTDDLNYYLENIEDRIWNNALYFGNGDETLAQHLAEEMITQRYQPATPSFLSAGRARAGGLISCFLLDITDDMNSIGRGINSALQLSKLGGGVGLSLSNLREAGAPIKGVQNAASGVIPVMKLLEDSFSYANQLGQRQGAGAVYLSVHHPDIMAFLSTKKENADEKIRVKTLSLGLVVTDKFYEMARKNEKLYQFSPIDVEREYGKPFSYVDITAEYDNMVANPRIKKTYVQARVLEEEISKLQQESGYPYVMNVDIVNRANPGNGRVIMSNLCSEILQSQVPSKINNNQDFEVMGQDISCNLGSLNMVSLMNTPNMEQTIETAYRALVYVSDSSNVDVVPTVKHGNDLNHTTALGLMGLHSYFAVNHVEYGSPESLEITNLIFLLMNYYTLKASNQIARERQQAFEDFEFSKYADGTYFEKYLTTDYQPKLDKVKELFKNIAIPTQDDWAQLKDDIQRYGLYSKYRMAVAPTGSISYVNGVSASIHPIINRIEERQEKKIGKIYYPAHGLSTDTIPYYTSAYDMDMRKVIDVYAAATEHVDQGLSLTLFVRSEIPEGMYEWKRPGETKQTTRDLSILRNYAYNKGIKTIYYVRTFTDDGDSIGANECESCSI
jgi:ribonucleoside-diphosphate reductase, alpha subunit